MNIEKFHDDEIRVQVLKPPFFDPTGQVVDRREAWEKGLWYPTVNLWVFQRHPVPSILYQQRSPNIGWAPGKLDVLIAGHCEELQTPIEAVNMEALEEMGLSYKASQIIPVGRKLSVGIGQDNTTRNSVVNLFLVEEDRPIDSFIQQKKEVYAVCACPLEELLKVHRDSHYSYEQPLLLHDGTSSTLIVNQESFPPNWDPYHQKMAFLIDQYYKGNKNLMY
jgi:8-oxo-dGTP pyrophosphatase MutT (NUDIX family)